MLITRLLTLLCCALLLCQTSFAADRSEQRAMFMQAKQALAAGNYAVFNQLSEQLKTYPLYPYLRFDALEQQLDDLTEQQVQAFIQQYADTPLANRLLDDWLDSLATQQRWALFKKYYQKSNNIQLQCGHLQALLDSGEIDIAFQSAAQLWLAGHALPTSCENVFFAWQKSGQLTLAQIWQRIELAFAKHNQTLVTQLAAWLPPSGQAQVKLWQQVHQQPVLVITQPQLFNPLTYRNKQILFAGIEQLAQKQPETAANAWPTLQNQYGFTPNEQQKIIRIIGIGLARNTQPEAIDWLEKIQPAHLTTLASEWRIRIALLNQDWQQVADWIQQLTPAEQQTPIWRYWYARAQAALGDSTTAQTIYQTLAKQIDYYGLLASQRLNQPYRPLNIVKTASPQMVSTLANTPSLQRAHELYDLNLRVDARREWQWEIAKLNPTQLIAAANLAKQWHWYDRMLVTAMKANLQNDIALRFPLAFQTDILFAAKQTGLEPSWLLAIMKQESAFIPDVKSRVGALGLMQLMPSTGRFMLSKLHLNLNDNLLNETTNIQLGSYYLKELFTRFKDNQTIATAAYNLGPTRLKKYMPLYETLGADIWVEILPWQETRNYVKNVSLNQAIYQQLLKGKK